jgi:hypothetical protein
MRLVVVSLRCCIFMLLLHVVSSAETPHRSVSAHHHDNGDGEASAASSSSSLALSLREIVQRHLQQEEDSTAATTTTSTSSSYSFLQLCHKISNLPNLDCECMPLLEQWQEAQQERKELDEAYSFIFDKIELQKIKCESTNTVCSSGGNNSNYSNDNDDVTCGRFTLDVVTANADHHDWSSRISQTTMRSCVMYTRMPTNVQLQPYRDGCVQWEYYTTTTTEATTISNSSSSSSSTNVLEQEKCHVSFMNLETATMEKCNACQVCYTTNDDKGSDKQQRGMNVDCDNLEPAASAMNSAATADNNNNNNNNTSTSCHVLDLDSFFPGFRRPAQEHHQEQQQQPPPQQTGSMTSSSPVSSSLLNMTLFIVASMVMLWYLMIETTV